MTEELKQAAQAALEALEEIALAGMSGTGQESEEGLRDWHARQAWKFIGIAARELEPLRRALTQRPAAQTEREADGLPPIVAGAIFDFAGFMTTRSEVIEVGSTAEAGPVADLVKEWAELRGLDLADAAVLSWQLHITRASLPAPQQATPEPVGEPFGWLFQHEETGLTEVVDCQQLEWGFEVNNPRWQKIRPVYTHPAPGVPDGFALVPVEPAPEMLKAMESQRLVGSQVDMAKREYAAMLAAAQAKGGQ